MKLVGKQRDGAKVTKRYDEPKTPLERVVAAGVIREEARAEFEASLWEWCPLALKRRLDAEIDRLWRLQADGTRLSTAVS